MNTQIFEFSAWVQIKNDKQINKLINSYLIKSEHIVLDELEHQFSPQGFTKIWLLAESHLALHTYPEENRAYIQLSSCNADKYYKFVKQIKKTISPTYYIKMPL